MTKQEKYDAMYWYGAGVFAGLWGTEGFWGAALRGCVLALLLGLFFLAVAGVSALLQRFVATDLDTRER